MNAGGAVIHTQNKHENDIFLKYLNSKRVAEKGCGGRLCNCCD